MLNLIWPIFLIISFVYGLCFGDISKTNSAIFESTESAVTLCISLLGTICLWNGIMKIAEKTSNTVSNIFFAFEHVSSETGQVNR